MSTPKPTFRVGNNGHSIVTDNPLLPVVNGGDYTSTYGGRLIAESLHPDMARKLVEILNAAVDVVPSEPGRDIKQQWNDMHRTNIPAVRFLDGKFYISEWRHSASAEWNFIPDGDLETTHPSNLIRIVEVRH